MKKEETIIEIMEHIYYVWDFISKEQARSMLKKLLMSNKLKTIEDKRLVLHNLATISIKIEEEKNQIDRNMSQARYYSKALIDMLDSYPNYKDLQLNKERYCRALNNYIDCYKDELTEEQLIENYKFHYETYKKYNYDENHIDEYREKLIAKYNLYMVKKNFLEILDIVKEFLLHNDNTQYEEAIQALIQEVKDINVMLYEQIIMLVQENYIQAV
jgi:hypothetical protein